MASHTNKSAGDLNSKEEHLENVSQTITLFAIQSKSYYGLGLETEKLAAESSEKSVVGWSVPYRVMVTLKRYGQTLGPAKRAW